MNCDNLVKASDVRNPSSASLDLQATMSTALYRLTREQIEVGVSLLLLIGFASKASITSNGGT